MLINQSNIRVDDSFEEMAGSAADNEGINAILTQIMELYYQFHDPDLDSIPEMRDNGQAAIGPDGKQVAMPIQRADLEVPGKLKILLAKTSTAMNPDVMFVKFMQIFSLLHDDPMVGGNPKGHLTLLKNLLAYARVENPDQYLPDEQSQQQILTNPQLPAIIGALASKMAEAQAAPKGGSGHARTRNGKNTSSTPSSGGSTRPVG
jgi:hypothetical protein